MIEEKIINGDNLNKKFKMKATSKKKWKKMKTTSKKINEDDLKKKNEDDLKKK
jgi:hypothetical protein